MGVAHKIKLLVGAHDAMGVDVVHALGGHVDLVLADGADEGVELAVDVGEAHAVVVVEVDGAHAAAGQHLDHIAAHAAHTEHGHAAAGQRGDGRLAKEELSA